MLIHSAKVTMVVNCGEFKLYLPHIVPQMLRVFMHDNSPGRVVTTGRFYFELNSEAVC